LYQTIYDFINLSKISAEPVHFLFVYL